MQLLSLPAPTATPFQLTANGSAPVPASLFIGNGKFLKRIDSKDGEEQLNIYDF